MWGTHRGENIVMPLYKKMVQPVSMLYAILIPTLKNPPYPECQSRVQGNVMA